MRERLTAADFRFLLICTILLGATAWFSASFFYHAFPEASIDFVVTRQQALAKAQQFLASQGYKTPDYRQAARFGFDDDAKTFLERELGLEKANQIMGKHVRLWRWSYRWFRPLNKEEFRVEVTTDGDIVSFHHELAEKTAGANLSSDQARSIAESFLKQVMGRDPASLEFVEAASKTRPARTDHTFTWKERDFQIKDATYRFEVTVLGDHVGGFNEYLKVPEAWTREYQHMRSRNETASIFDAVLLVLLVVGGLAVLIMRVRNRDVRWGRAGLFGGIAALLYLLSNLNGFPLQEFGYPTTDSYGSFLANRLFQALMGSLGMGAFILLLTAFAEPLYRESYGRFLSIGSFFRWRGLRTRSFFRGTALGITLAGIFVAYQIAFYWVAFHFGAWSPADVPYSDMLNTSWPWLFVLFGGFFPAVSEEFLFRMFSIPFLTRLLRRPWLAIVVAGFIWGFGHVAYPQQPFYIRGVEVGIGGVALGIIMLRFGILPTLVWHYSVDAMYGALLLLRSHNPYFIFSGAASAGIMLIPLLVAGIAYIRFKGFEPETGLTNADEGTSQPEAVQPAPAPPPVPSAYVPWPRARVLAALGIAATLIAIAFALPKDRVADTEFKLDAQHARAAAGDFLRSRSLDPSAFHNVVYPENAFSGLTARYFLERRPLSYVRKMATDYQPLLKWTVRYFKPLDKEEIQVSVDPENGNIVEFHHDLPEDRPGADLSSDAARQLASQYLAGHGFDLSTLELKETNSEKRKARRDHSMIWEAKTADPRNLDEAHYRVNVAVAGNQVVRLATLWKLPEEFERERGRTTAMQIVTNVVRITAILGAVILGIWVVLRKTRQHDLRWKEALVIGGALAILSALSSICSYPLLFRAFNTAWSLEMFQAMMLVGLLIAAIGIFIASAFGGALLLALRPDFLSAFSPGSRRKMARDAVVCLLLGSAVFLFVSQVREFLTAQFHAQASLDFNAPLVFASLVPAISDISSAASSLLLWSVVLAIIARVALDHLKRPWLIALAAALVAVGFSSGHTPGEFLLQYAMTLISVALYGALFIYFFRRNYLAYALWLWTMLLAKGAYHLASQPAPSLRMHGWITAAFLVATIVWTFWPALQPETSDRARGVGQS